MSARCGLPASLAPILLALPWSMPTAMAGVVHTADGAALIGRVEALAEARAIRVLTVDGAREVARSHVVHVEHDADLRRNLQTTVDLLEVGDAAGLWRSSQWAMRKGLFDEAFALMDRALTTTTADGAQGPALAPDMLDLPVLGIARTTRIDDSDAWRLLQAAADTARPATAAAALARLAQRAATDDVDAALRKALAARDPALRAVALQVAERARPAALWSEVVRALFLDADAQVRQHAIRAARAYDDPRILGPLQRALAQGGPRLRETAMDAVEGLQEVGATSALVAMLRRRSESGGGARAYVHWGEQRAFVSDFDVDVANSAFIANPNIGVLQTGAVQDTTVLATSAKRFPAAHHARAATILAGLTGQDFGTDWMAWQRWIDQRGTGAILDADGTRR